MSPFVPAVLLAAGCAVSACQRTTQTDRSASTQRPAPVEVAKQSDSEETAENSGFTTQPSAAPKPEKTPPPPKKKRYVVAVLGDSITDAKNGGGGFLAVLRDHCPKSQFLNFGKGGDMTNQMRRRFDNDVVPQIAIQKINTVVVYGGVNDLYSDLSANRKNDKIEEDLTHIYQLAQARGLYVIAVTVSPWGGFSKYWNPRRGQNTQLLNSWILGQEATGLVDKAVDSFAPLSCGDPNVLCPDYETRFHDGLHPGKEGHKVLGERLAVEAFSDCL